MSTYKLGSASASGQPVQQLRRPVICEYCLEALGSVPSEAALNGMSATLVAAIWPELKLVVYQHDQKCRPDGPVSHPGE